MNKFFSSKGFLYLAGVGIAVLILKRFDLLPRPKTADEKLEQSEEKEKTAAVKLVKQKTDIWNTYAWKEFPNKAFTPEQATNLAKHIRSAFGFFNDDEAQIYGVFRTLKYQVNVSQIAFEYARLYGRDLRSDLYPGYLSQSEMNEVFYIISQKPE